jgi:putative Mg2+ transporter-C (MgtC) family protein
MDLPVEQQILRLALALVLGAAIGFERERLARTAGLRTHALVSVGSALVIIVSTYGFRSVETRPGVGLDPSRVAAQVVSGIGFLGAGTIIVANANVRGLTTAASIWAVAGIGLACGAGLYEAAGIATLFCLFILWPLKVVEQRFIHSGAGHNKLEERDSILLRRRRRRSTRPARTTARIKRRSSSL